MIATYPRTIEETIANGEANSGGSLLDATGTLCGLYATEACTNAISIQVSHDGSTWYDVDGVTALTISGAKFYPMAPSTYSGALYVRVHSAGNEGAERTFYLAVRAV